MNKPQDEPYLLCERVAALMNQHFRGVRAKLTVSLDGFQVQPHDVAVEFRPPQPKAGMVQEARKI